MTAPRNTLLKLTTRETLAPWIRRLRMSRPNRSVPSKLAEVPPSIHAGGARRRGRSCSNGSCGAIHGPNTATSKNAITVTVPITPLGSPNSALKKAKPAVASATCCVLADTEATAETGDSCTLASTIPDPRVNNGVQSINKDVDDYHYNRHNEYSGLHQRKIPPLHPEEDQTPKSRPAEDRLDDHAARNDLREPKGNQREDWDECVAQGMLEDDDSL